MNGERELHSFLSEKTHQNYGNNNHHYNHQKLFNGVSSSSSCSDSTSGFLFPDIGSGSSSIPSFDHPQFPLPKPHFVDQFSRSNNAVFPDEIGLAREFGKMNIANRISSDIAGLERETEGFRVSDYNVPKNWPSNGQNYESYERFLNGFSGNGGLSTPLYRSERNLNDELSFRLGQSWQNGNGNENWSRSRNCSIDFPFDQANPPRLNDSYANFLPILDVNKGYNDGLLMNRTNNYLGNGDLFQRRDSAYSNLIPLQVLSMYEPQNFGDSLHQSMYSSPYSNNDTFPYGGSMDFPQLDHFTQALSMENLLYNSMTEKKESEIPQSVSLMKKGRQFETYGCENSFILKENGMSTVVGNTCQKTMERSHEMSCTSMAEVQGKIYLMAKEQQGCRFLQKKFEKGSFEDVTLIFNELIDNIVELMLNQFGNYLIQKLLEVCNEEQRMRILHTVTRDEGELVRISLNSQGTRVVQKLIETVKTKQQISVVIQALEPGFLDLIKDLNGNHVLQRCLQCLSSEDNKFIFDAAAKFCVEIATHRHGCCVLQRCIAHCTGEHQKKLVEVICANGLNLAQDPYGNYVVQYIIELKIPEASAQLTSKFEGHYIQLSTQKFSSHVVEKCLKYIEKSRARIVYELLSVSHFEQLLQDPYANYVIQSALEVTKGAVNDTLVAAVRPHSMLRTNPYCKKIFSRGILKK